MNYRRRLKTAVAFASRHLTLVLVVHGAPALEHVEHLKVDPVTVHARVAQGLCALSTRARHCSVAACAVVGITDIILAPSRATRQRDTAHLSLLMPHWEAADSTELPVLYRSRNCA